MDAHMNARDKAELLYPEHDELEPSLAMALQSAFRAGADWQANGPITDAQVEAAAKAFWPAYSRAVRVAPIDKRFGVTPSVGHECNVIGMRAALQAAQAVSA
jgi:hypothetical protein